MLLEVGEVDRALPVAAHQVQALAGVGTRASLAVALVLGIELDEALVGDHRALAGEDVVVALQGEPEHLLVLQAPAVLGLLVVVGEKRTLHGVLAPPQPRTRRRSVLSSLGWTTTMPWPEKAIW